MEVWEPLVQVLAACDSWHRPRGLRDLEQAARLL